MSQKPVEKILPICCIKANPSNSFSVSSSNKNVDSNSETKSKVKKIKITGHISNNDLLEFQPKLKFNGVLYFVSQLLILIVLGLLIIWQLEYFGGYDWNAAVINFHPIIMLFAFVFLLSNLLLFLDTSLRLQSSRIVLFILIVILGLFGSFTAIYWHIIKNENHLQSMHSWLGILSWSSMLLFILMSIYVYLNKNLFQNERLIMIYYLRILGVAVLVLVTTTAIIGLSGRVLDIFNHNVSNFISAPNFVANLMVVFLICYISAMIYMMTLIPYKPHYHEQRDMIEKHIRNSIERAMNKLESAGAFNDDDFSTN